MSTTPTPASSSPAISARWRPSPLGRLSRPTDIVPLTPFSARNAAYAPATAAATSSVRSLPATPRMSYSRNMAREIATVLLVGTESDVPAHSGRTALRERHYGVGEKAEDQNDRSRGPDHSARPSTRVLGERGP